MRTVLGVLLVLLAIASAGLGVMAVKHGWPDIDLLLSAVVFAVVTSALFIAAAIESAGREQLNELRAMHLLMAQQGQAQPLSAIGGR